MHQMRIYTIVLFLLLCLSFLQGEPKQVKTKDILGYSTQNREIPIYKFGNGNDVIILLAGIYGDESKSIALLQELKDTLKNNTQLVPKKKSLWIIPLLNPDGLVNQTRFNANEIDLNRNFDTDGWKNSDWFYSYKVNCGEKPFSEIETKVLFNLLTSQKNKKKHFIVISLFSNPNMTNNVIMPGGNTPSSKVLMDFVNKFLIDFSCQKEYDGCGKLSTWLSTKMQIPAIKIKYPADEEFNITKLDAILTELCSLNFNKLLTKKNNIICTENNIILTFPKKIQDSYNNETYNLKTIFDFLDTKNRDKELLLLVSKQHYLCKDYAPNDLIQMADIFPSTKKSLFLREILLESLSKMFEDTKNQSLSLTLVSCYRSYETQIRTFNYWTRTLGEEEAKRVSARPGSSQHQLGTAIDFNSLNETFGETDEGKWLLKNSFLYGFVISYPNGWSDITGYSYEPWHFRYIGKDSAFVVKNYFNNILELFLRWYWEITTE